MKITYRDVLNNTIGSLGAMLVVWVLGLLVSAFIDAVDPTGKIFHDGCINWSWDTFKTLLCTPIPLWIVLTFISVAVFIIVFRRKLRNPPFLKEREMNVGGFRRTWEWEYDKENKRYMVYRLNTYCPDCGALLTCSMDGYNCVKSHHYDTQDIAYTNTLDAIVDSLQKKYPKYRDFIGRHHTLYE